VAGFLLLATFPRLSASTPAVGPHANPAPSERTRAKRAPPVAKPAADPIAPIAHLRHDCSSEFATSDLVRGLARRKNDMHLLWFLLIGLVAGWLTGQLMKGGGYGLIGDLVLGVVGAFVGGWIFGALGIHAGGLIGSLITATVGAVVLVLLVRLIKKA
jgi:uncharacterized membrane protein YeaQ/YmgE (transglycosylase-associated protein family)